MVLAAEAKGDATSDSAPVATADDTTMVDADPKSDGAVEANNSTPDTAKKSSNGGSRRKSSVPEHKSKKLNKKKSKPTLRLNAQAGELYLARMKGHPPWPSIIADEDMLPDIIKKNRPVTAAQPDGTFKKADYAEGGKREHERTFPIMFL